MAASTLTIAGSTITRPTSKILLNRWTLPIDRPGELEFTELAVSLPGSFAPEQAVTLTISGTVVFNGWIFQRIPGGFTRESGRVGYRCLDQKFAAYMIPITASDGTGTMAFNLPSTALNYQSTESGLSVGTILSQVFAQHSTQLATIGVSTDATTATQLATLVVTPPDPVYMQGNRLWSQVDQLLQQWYGSKIAIVITGAGLIRVIDTTALSASTLTFGTDPVFFDSLQEDTSECYTAVLVRGRDNVDGAYVSQLEGTVIDPHNAAGDNLEATWTMADFLTPKGASDTGTVTTSSSTTITVKSDSGSLTWASNYWSGIQAQVSAIDPLGTTINAYETHRVISNTALTAGGTSILTVDVPFSSTGFTRYALRGQPVGKSECYRRLNFLNTYVAEHLVSQFNFAMNWSPSQGGVSQTWFPVGVVLGVAGGVPFEFPAQFELIPFNGTTPGYIRFFQPWVSYFNSQSNLNAGGSSVVQATDLKFLIPFSRGTMSVRMPSSSFSGTAFSRFNVQRVLTRDYQTWWDQGSTTAMGTLASNILDTVSNVVQEGQVTYVGQYLTALVPGAPIALNLANYAGTTSYEAMAAPCRTVSLEWMQGSYGSPWATRIQFSTRRQMYSGDRLYVHPAYGSSGALSGAGFSGLSVSGMPQGNSLVSAYENANIGTSNEFSPVFNQGEIGAFDRATQAEVDTRPQDTFNQMQRQEQRATDQQFGRGADPTAQ